MKAETLIGVYDWERGQPQTLLLDLVVGVPEKSGAGDDINGTIHYADACAAVRASLKNQRFLLLEALAEHIADLMFSDFGAQWVRVKIVKPGILPDVREVGVEIERSIN